MKGKILILILWLFIVCSCILCGGCTTQTYCPYEVPCQQANINRLDAENKIDSLGLILNEGNWSIHSQQILLYRITEQIERQKRAIDSIARFCGKCD